MQRQHILDSDGEVEITSEDLLDILIRLLEDAEGYPKAVLQVAYQAYLGQGNSQYQIQSYPIEAVKDFDQFFIVFVSRLERMEELCDCLSLLFRLDLVEKVS